MAFGFLLLIIFTLLFILLKYLFIFCATFNTLIINQVKLESTKVPIIEQQESIYQKIALSIIGSTSTI
jgi:hypothetical protein